MDIVVTGAVGQAGSWTVDHFADAGYEVLGLDVGRPPGDRANVEFRPADVTNQGEILELILDADPDVVIHFAGLRSDRGSGNAIFRTNVQGTYNVLEAAGRTDADVIWASSEAAYGRLFSDNPLEYLPIDESHPTRPRRPYGTSKLLGEEAGKAVSRRYGISVVSMRATYIRYPGEYWTETLDPDDEERLGATKNLWGYVDIRDVLTFIEAAVEADLDGHEAFNVSAVDNRAGAPTRSIVEAVYGSLPEQCDVADEEAVFSTEKARELLDWTPTHRWRDAAEEDAYTPSFLE
ncbi:NAD-dependent epimerase/dehydratase family protein [Halorubrum sp. CBA1125]|uniref:NAD-dependent epimerase/dehydratase family protein n=1 Tax=Halorubrum sp. CBA1125 TaxID=2668072 RepID=UPI0012E73F99|nr:NAD(P)-dependent oxidoreductase [Halorubrum sp. CBA1125]MUW14822.1 NAD-dependent epimerase/dehydratase family protein [Halorubrum sp. CBA1125]